MNRKEWKIEFKKRTKRGDDYRYSIYINSKKEGELKSVNGFAWNHINGRFFIDEELYGSFDYVKELILSKYRFEKLDEELRKEFGDDFLEG